MSTQTCYLYKSTYIDMFNQNTNYSTATMLRTNLFPLGTRHFNPTGFNFLDYTYNSTGFKNRHVCSYAPIVQFLIPSTLKYKRINSVKLRHYRYWATNTSYGDTPYMDMPLTNAFDVVQAYLYSGDLTDVTWSNVRIKGEIGGCVGTLHTDTHSGYSGAGWYEADVTSLFNDSLQNDQTISFFILDEGTAQNLESIAATQGRCSGIPTTIHYPELVIDYSDVEQLAPTPSYPNGVYLKEGDPILFTWQHNSETRAIQASYRLNYKLTSASTWTEVTGFTEHSYSITDGLAAGAYEWRIKITNDAGESSDWSETASFSVVGKPTVPVVNDPEEKCLTAITWNTSDQNAYELKLTLSGELIYETSEASAVAKCKINKFLGKGIYTVSVRVRNSIDLWSDWAVKTFTLDPDIPEEPTASLRALDTYIAIDFKRSEATDHIAIMRSEDGGEDKVIALVDDDVSSYEDHTVKSGVQYTYKAREYADGYTDGHPMSGIVSFGGMVLRADDIEVNLTQSNDKYLAINESVERESAVLQFSGREFPLVERGEYTDWTLERKFYVTDEQRADLEKIMIKNNAFYRDSKGRAFACALLSCKYQEFMDEGFLATLQLVRTDEDEVVINV